MSNVNNLTLLMQWLIHVILLAALLGKAALLYVVIAKFSPDWQERIMRSIAATCGCSLVLGAKALGLSVPELLLHALTMSGALLTGVIGALLPGAIGFICAWYVCRYFSSRNRRRNVIGMRILAMMMATIVLLYGDTFVAALDPAHAGDIKLVLPNLSFALAIMLVAVFKYYPLPDDAAMSEA